jgi:hypothetical protein
MKLIGIWGGSRVARVHASGFSLTGHSFPEDNVAEILERGQFLP